MKKINPRVGLAALAVLALASSAWADGEGRMARVPLNPKYQQECAACHLAYPPGMLPAASWQRMMTQLPQHFGSDASLDPATLKELSSWLGANAGTYKRVREEPPQDRITRSAWFVRKHDEVAAATWKLPAVKSAANCAACHTRADQGDFNERYVRIPR
ncbi:MAG: diheme cytochrome c [Burkholderiaceae bacterium]|nr:diheme cytochrome c [Burkholderiaceae bacterium]